MQVTMDNLSKKITVEKLTPKDNIELLFEGEEALASVANTKGKATFNCKKLIDNNLRKEVKFIVVGKEQFEHIYEVRATKLIFIKTVEIRKG